MDKTKYGKKGYGNVVLIVLIVVFTIMRIEKNQKKDIVKNIETQNIESQNIELIADYDEFEKKLLEAKIYSDNNNIEEADKILSEIKYYMDPYYELAQIYFEEEEYVKSKIWYQIAYKKGNKRALYYLAQFTEIEGNYEKAEKYWREAVENKVELAPKELVSLLKRKNKGNKEEIIKIYTKGAEGNDGESMYELVKIYYLENNLEKMNYWINKINNTIELLEYDEDMEMAIKNMQGNENDKKYINKYIEAEENIELRNFEKAEENFKEMEKYKKEGIKYLALFYVDIMKNYEKAEEILLKANSEGIDVSYELGYLYYEIGDIVKEKESYISGVKKDNIESLIAMGRILWGEGKKEESIELKLKAIKGKDYMSILNLFSYYSEKNDVENIKKWVNYVKTTPGLKNYGTEDKMKIEYYIKKHNIVLSGK